MESGTKFWAGRRGEGRGGWDLVAGEAEEPGMGFRSAQNLKDALKDRVLWQNKS